MRKTIKYSVVLMLAGLAACSLKAQTITLTDQDVGAPTLKGSMTTTTVAGDKVYTITGGGDDIWNNSDNFHYAYMMVTGDFDYVVKVQDLQGPDNWSKAELMARQIDASVGKPQGGDPHISNMATRSGGQNQLGPQWRTARSGGSDRWVLNPIVNPTYPDTWLRLKRVGSAFYQYSSTDGRTWTSYNPGALDTAGSSPAGSDGGTRFNAAWPATIAVGLAVTAHNDTDTTGGIAVFSNLGLPVPVAVAITTQPAATVTAALNAPVTLSAMASGDPIYYQWLKNGVAIPGASGFYYPSTNLITYTIQYMKASDAGTYALQVSNSVKTVVSANSVLTALADTTPPTLVSANPNGNPIEVLVAFSEPVEAASATNKANYQISNGITVTGAALKGSDTVMLMLGTSLVPSVTYTLTVNGVRDQATTPNTIAANSKATFKLAGVVQVNFYDNTNGGTGTNDAVVYAAARISGGPSRTLWMSSFETPAWENGGNYLGMIQGYLVPATTDDYVFAIATDDSSWLYLSTDDKPANKVPICFVNGWTNQRQYSKYPEQTSQPIHLIAGRKYYIQSLWVEGGGGDGCAVTWQPMSSGGFINDNDPAITGDFLMAYKTPGDLVITNQIKSVTLNENQNVTFSLVEGVDGSPPYYYQWYRNGAAIAGANSFSYSLTPALAADNGAVFTCVVSNLMSSVTSSPATLTVIKDVTPPTLVGAQGTPNILTTVVLTFSERLNKASAETAANYSISTTSGPVNVTAASLSADGTKVTLTTAPQTLGTKHTVTVKSVTDIAAVPNTLASGTKTIFFPLGKIVQDANGFVVFETENFDRNLDGLWLKDTTRGLPSGGASMVVPTGGSETATQLQYDVEFKKAGTYILWYRASGNDGGSDSGWFIIDGGREPNRTTGNQDSLTGFSGQLDFVWLSQPQDGGGQFTFDIGSAGPHVLGVARRENNAYFDKFIVTSDPAYRPTGLGPAETRQGMPGLPTIKISAPTDGQQLPGATPVTLTVNASGASGLDIARVEFTANGNKIGEATASPFSFTWSNIKAGIYSIQATVTDEIGGVATSPAIQITVGTPPTLEILGVGAVKNSSGGYDVGIQFDKPLEPISAALAANYTVTGGTISGVTYMPKSPGVVLKMTGLTEGNKYTVTVKNVANLQGQKITSASMDFTASKMAWGVVGADELQLGNGVLAVSDNGFDVYSDGIGEWATYDEATLVYEQITGDFDKKVRVEFQDTSSQWARAGLIMREVTNFGVDRAAQTGTATAAPYDGKAGRYQKVHVNPVNCLPSSATGTTSGNNLWEGNRRLDVGGPTSSAITGANSNPKYPNAWCRIQRQSQTFTIYRSDNGTTWVNLSSFTWPDPAEPSSKPIPATVYVGVDYSPENGNIFDTTLRSMWLAKFRDYGDTFPLVQPTLTWLRTATGITITFVGTLQSADQVAGPWVDVAGASPQTVPTSGTMKYYRVRR